MKTPPNSRGRGRPRRSERDAGRSRAELIDAAAAVFAEHGYEGTTVEEVIHTAGLSKGTFYFNFRGKDDLFAAVLEARLDEPARALMALTADAAGDTPTAGAVSAGLAELLRTERPTLLLLHEYLGQAARDRALALRYLARQATLRTALAATLEQRHQHTGVKLTFDADRLAQAMIALAQGLAFDSILDPDAVDPGLFGEMLALIYDGLVLRAEQATTTES